MNTDILSSLNLNQQNWLMDPHSLTQRLREHTHHHITFHMLHDHWKTVDDKKTWVRDIEFRYNGVLWISAIVIIPKSSITCDTIELSQVGNQAIGDILFQDPTLSRSKFTFCKIAHMQFSRRSLFHYKEKPLLIVETFFPAFFEEIS